MRRWNTALAWPLSRLVGWPSELDFVVVELEREQVQLEGLEEREQEG